MNQNPAPDPIAELMRQAASLDPEGQESARVAFLERVDDQLERDSRRLPRRAWMAPLALAAAVALAFLSWPETSLTYRVSGAAEDGGYVRAQAGVPAQVLFSDATTLRAAPGTRLRVVETQARGARISVEQGKIGVSVTHTGSSAWNFVAGPFDVHVTGTRFELRWDAQSEVLQVELHEGSVEITGYDGSSPMAVSAGQRFLGNAQARTMQISDLAASTGRGKVATITGTPPRSGDAAEEKQLEKGPESSSGATAEAKDRVVTSDQPAAKESQVRSGSPPREASASWSTLVSRGQFADVVAAAEARGVDSCLSACGAAELTALADAARYKGNSGLAEKSLQALRTRFSGATRTRAAFLLGRLHEGLGHASQAKTWYQTALSESPSGAYAGEALAGKMRTMLSLGGRAQAQPIAQEYLKRYPDGVHTAAAKKITSP